MFFDMILAHTAALILGAGAAVAAAHSSAPISRTKLQYRTANCTFTDAVEASRSKTSCSTIVLSNITVPAGTTLDMTKLGNGTTVGFIISLVRT
jgi:polygalacturonase